MRQPSSQQGFSLLELLVVIAIIGILSTSAALHYANSREQAKEAKTFKLLEQVGLAFEYYRTEQGVMPPNGTWADELKTHSSIEVPIEDIYGNAFFYQNNFRTGTAGRPSLVCSLGQDGTLQTNASMSQSQGDDICIFMREPDDT